MKTSSIIVSALVASQVMFGIVVLMINGGKMEVSMPSLNDPLTIALFVLLITNLMASHFIYKAIVSKAKAKTIEVDKFQMYASAIILRCAMIEGISLFAIVIAMLNVNAFYLIIAAALATYIFCLRPTAERIDAELELGLGGPMIFK